MSAVPTALAQLLARPDPVADPATVKLLRAALEALQHHSGETVAARIVGPLPGGLTQLLAGTETLILKLATPLPPGAAVSLKITTGPDGQPAVSIETQPHAPAAAPAPIPQRAASLIAQASVPAPVTQPLAPQPAAPAPAITPTAAPAPAATAPAAPAQPPTAAPPAPAQPAPLSAVTTPATAPPAGTPPAGPVAATLQVPAPPLPAAAAPAALPGSAATPPPPPPAVLSQQQAMPPVSAQVTPVPIPQPTTPVPPAPAAPAAVATPLAPAQSQQPPAVPAQAAAPAPLSTDVPLATPAPLSSIPAAYPQPARPQPATAQLPLPSSPPAAAPSVTASSPPVSPAPPTAQPAIPAPAPPVSTQTLTLTDPVQAAARQQSIAPLLASLSTLAAAATPLPRPVIEAALKVLATRIDLNQAPPTPTVLREAVLGAGVLAQPAAVPTDAKLALLQLRSALVAFLGHTPPAFVPAARRPPPPLRGEDPRAPSPESPPPDDGTPHDAARTLLGHTDGALSRLKLLQVAAQPADLRPADPARPAEYRVEIPMLLGAETGVMQLQVQRDARNKSQPKARGWRVRFALNFSAIGEVGADVSLLGQSASVSLWAADPETAETLEAMLPELAPALAARGLDVTGVRLRRGAPQKPARAPGQLLDSAT